MLRITRTFSLVIRFFTTAKGVQVRLLDMKDFPGDDSQLLADFIAQMLEKNGLKWENIVSFCADNAPVFDVDPAETKWQSIFKGKDLLPCLYRLFSTILSIQLANAFVERIFSMCKSQCTDTRSLLQLKKVKAALQVRGNVDIDYAEIYQLLIKNRELLKKVHGVET